VCVINLSTAFKVLRGLTRCDKCSKSIIERVLVEYTLDFSRWRCGGNGVNKLGEGPINMRNREGFLCCLGHFAVCVGVAIPTGTTPAGTAEDLGRNYDSNMVKPVEDDVSGDRFSNTSLAKKLMGINDHSELRTRERIKRIRNTLEALGHTLVVDNLPEELAYLSTHRG